MKAQSTIPLFIALILLVACDRPYHHDTDKQMKLLHQCITAHTMFDAKQEEVNIPGGVVTYCEQWAESETRVYEDSK